MTTYAHLCNYYDSVCFFLKGANFLVRKLVASVGPSLDITQEDNHFIIKTVSTFMTKTTEFHTGEERTEKQPNGVEFKVNTSQGKVGKVTAV